MPLPHIDEALMKERKLTLAAYQSVIHSSNASCATQLQTGQPANEVIQELMEAFPDTWVAIQSSAMHVYVTQREQLFRGGEHRHALLCAFGRRLRDPTKPPGVPESHVQGPAALVRA